MKAVTQFAGAVLIFGASGALGCTSDSVSSPGDGGQATNAVSVRDNFFTPTPANVAVGDTVTWTWQGINPHTVTFDPDDSPTSPIQTSETYSRQFDAAGTFTYYCTVHGRAIMSGSVVVQ